MVTTVPCPKCTIANQPSARFCTGCGTGLGGQSCGNCGAQLKGGAFCTSCGGRTVVAQPSGPGSITGGKWVRAPGEFVRRVTFDELRSQFDSDLKTDGGFWSMLVNFGQQALRKMENLYVVIPQGSVAVVMFDGVVTEILQPGRQRVSGFMAALMQGLESTEGAQGSLWDRVRNAFTQGATAAVETLLSSRLDRTSIYLVDTRPIPVPYQLNATGSSEDHALDVRLDVYARVAGANPALRGEAFGLFLSRCVGDAVSLDTQTVHRQLLPHVERLAKDAVERFRDASGPNLAQVQQYVKERLGADVGAGIGLAFDVLVYTDATTLSLRLHLGQAQLPEIRACVNETCGKELKFGQRFCVGCGIEQPTVVDSARSCGKCEADVPIGQKFCTDCGTLYVDADPRTTRLLTSDGEPIEIDLTLRARCDRERKDSSRVVASLVASSRALLRSMTYEDASTLAGMARLETALVAGVKEVLLQLNLELLGLSVLDVRGRNGEWVQQANSDVRRAIAEIGIGREWLVVDGDRLALQSSTLELVWQRLRLENDDSFQRAQLQRDAELRDTLARIGHRFGLDVAELEDREQRQDLANRDAALAQANAVRDSRLATAIDEARREAARALRDRTHDDSLTDLRQGAQVEDFSDTRRRGRETDQMGHQMDLENRAAEHDEGRMRQGAQLQSDLERQGVQDAAYAAQVGFDQGASEAQRKLDRAYIEDQRRQDLGLGRQRSEQEILLDRQRAEQALRLESARAQHDLEQSAANAASSRDADGLRLAMQLRLEAERAEAEQGQARVRLEAELEQARMRLEAEREAERMRLENERLAGKSGAEASAILMAGRAAELANAEHGAAFAAAIAQQGDGATRLEMTQQMAERERELFQQMMERDRQAAQSSKDDMREMMGQFQAQNQANSGQSAVLFQQAFQTMSATTAALAGANRAAQDQTVDAHRAAAQQAQSMSERSMDAMSNVASTASRGPQQVIMDPRIRPPMPVPDARVGPTPEPPKSAGVAPTPTTCVHCAAPMEPGGRFCGACGQGQG